jgi:hypothetical protein
MCFLYLGRILPLAKYADPGWEGDKTHTGHIIDEAVLHVKKNRLWFLDKKVIWAGNCPRGQSTGTASHG